MQLVEVMTKNDELKADISKAQEKSADVTLGQLQHIQGQKLRANELIKEIEKFRCTELKALEQEVNDLSAAQRKTSNDLTLETRELQALLQCLRGKERQVYGELWRLEDEATVLEGKIQCWKLFEEISLNAGEESRQRHQQALSVLDAMVQDFTKVNRKAEEVCLSLASQCLL